MLLLQTKCPSTAAPEGVVIAYSCQRPRPILTDTKGVILETDEH